jgi:hypothetical protein
MNAKSILQTLIWQSGLTNKKGRGWESERDAAEKVIEEWLDSSEEYSDTIYIPGSGGVVRVLLHWNHNRVAGGYIDYIPPGCDEDFTL